MYILTRTEHEKGKDLLPAQEKQSKAKKQKSSWLLCLFAGNSLRPTWGNESICVAAPVVVCVNLVSPSILYVRFFIIFLLFL